MMDVITSCLTNSFPGPIPISEEFETIRQVENEAQLAEEKVDLKQETLKKDYNNDEQDKKNEAFELEKAKIRFEKLSKLKNVRIPYFLNPFILQNAGVTLSYFDVGVAIYFLITPVSYYLIKVLNASSTQFSAYGTLIGLPWSLKFIFGMISDGNPIFNYRRKSWMLFGWSGFVCISFYLAYLGTPDVTMTTVLMFLMTCLYLLADVCTDTLCVERARYETEAIKGSLQTSGYTIRAFGCVIGAVLGAILYNTADWGWGLTIAQIFALNALIPLTGIMPTIWHMEELASKTAAPTLMEQFESIWTTLQLRAVWLPISFIYTYGVFQIPNAAWTNFLILGLDFSDFEIGMLTVASAILYWLGMIAYKAIFFDSSWRMIYIYTTILNLIFSLLQIVLILRLNVPAGIPDFAFALGDSSITTFSMAIQSMPSCIMFIMLCPEGSEGITYALLTTIGNLSYSVASDIGSAMTLIWDVSNETLESGDYSGLLKLTILTSCLQVAPLALVWLLPDSKEEQRKLQRCGITSYSAGLTLAIVIVASLLGTIAVSIYFIWY